MHVIPGAIFWFRSLSETQGCQGVCPSSHSSFVAEPDLEARCSSFKCSASCAKPASLRLKGLLLLPSLRTPMDVCLPGLFNKSVTIPGTVVPPPLPGVLGSQTNLFPTPWPSCSAIPQMPPGPLTVTHPSQGPQNQHLELGARTGI